MPIFSEHKNKAFITLSFLLFSLLVGFYYLRNTYYEDIEILDSRIFSPHVVKDGFTLFSTLELVDPPPTDAAMHISLPPGGTFSGTLGIKNFDTESHTYTLEMSHDVQLAKDRQHLSFKNVTLDDANFSIEPGRIAYGGYHFTLPSDIEPGEYRLNARVFVSDPSAKNVREGNILLRPAVGVDFTLHVAEGATPFTYKDITLQSKELAKTLLIQRLRLVAFVVLTLFSLFAIVLHFYLKKK